MSRSKDALTQRKIIQMLPGLNASLHKQPSGELKLSATKKAPVRFLPRDSQGAEWTSQFQAFWLGL
jgi:hypothetical protein